MTVNDARLIVFSILAEPRVRHLTLGWSTLQKTDIQTPVPINRGAPFKPHLIQDYLTRLDVKPPMSLETFKTNDRPAFASG